ncbi:MAG: hypothetical protein EOO43_02670 [Flavobacterium sp.]|nr:MAG: hypothetical protein EOO43_02670 [Flavobacterium sp.]
MKKILLTFIISGYTLCQAQQNEINFLHQNINFSAAPRTSISPMSIKMWDNYDNGGPTRYGTVLEFYGKSSHQTGQLYFGGWDSSKIRYREAFYGETNWSNWITLLDSKNNLESAGNLMLSGSGNHFISSGKLGIGKSNPEDRLDIDGAILLKGATINTSLRPALASTRINGEIRAYSQTALGADDGLLRLSAGGGSNTYVLSYIDISGYSTIPDMDRNIVVGTGGEERLRVATNGNVGIGTSTPKEKLSVNGKIRAHEVKVESANWPDYVFEDTYKPKTLPEIERFIKVNRHLPEVPSAKEVERNGIELGEMNKILLKKIEELTLLLIEQNKRISKLESNKN